MTRPRGFWRRRRTCRAGAVLTGWAGPFKEFTLPKESAKTKFRPMAHEGCPVHKVALATLASVA